MVTKQEVIAARVVLLDIVKTGSKIAGAAQDT
jgi:hypothetical protein